MEINTLTLLMMARSAEIYISSESVVLFVSLWYREKNSAALREVCKHAATPTCEVNEGIEFDISMNCRDSKGVS
jgi:hypothetical protein